MRSLATITLATTLLLGACTTNDPPPPPPTPTTPPTPSATLPPMPEAASEFTPKGASTFVGYFIEVLQYAAYSSDTEKLRILSSNACDGCMRYVELFERVESDGGWTSERDWSKAAESQLQWVDHRGEESLYTTKLTVSAGTIKTASDAPEQQVPENSSQVTFALSYDDGWTVTRFELSDTE